MVSSHPYTTDDERMTRSPLRAYCRRRDAKLLYVIPLVCLAAALFTHVKCLSHIDDSATRQASPFSAAADGKKAAQSGTARQASPFPATVNVKKAARAMKILWIALTYLSMLMQSALLIADNQWSVRTGLPLHVCGFSGVLTLPALTLKTPALSRFFRRAASPCALLALLFPAVYPTRFMLLGEISFFLLHSLLLSLPLLLPREKTDAKEFFHFDSAVPPLEKTMHESAYADKNDASDPRRARETLPESDGATGMYRLCLALLVMAITVNRVYQANYLFLRALPPGAPFDALNNCPEGIRALTALALAVCLSYAGRKRSSVHRLRCGGQTKKENPDGMNTDARANKEGIETIKGELTTLSRRALKESDGSG